MAETNILEAATTWTSVLYEQLKQAVASRKGSAMVIAVVIAIFMYWFFDTKSQFPVMGRAWSLDFRKAMEQGNAKYPDKPFVIPFMDRTVILPQSALPALKNLPDKYLSTNANMNRRFAIEWTGSGWVSQEFNESLKVDLSRNLNGMLGSLEDEAKFSVHDQFGDPRDWQSVSLLEKMSQIIALTTGRIFVGLPLSRNPRWSGAIQEHTTAVMMFSFKLRVFPLWLRPYVARFILFTDLWKVDRTKREIGSLLKGVIGERLDEQTGAAATATDRAEKPVVDEERGRLLSWIIRRYRESKGLDFDKEMLVRDHFTLSFAAAGVPALILTHAVIDLAVRPELFARLRHEVEREIARSEDGALGAKALTRLSLLDSFLKESMRFNPPGIVAWLRMTHEPLSLPSGDVIPPDTLVAFCNPRFNKNIKTIPNADQFIADRWIRKKGDAGADSAATDPKSETTTIDPVTNIPLSATGIDDLSFGYGLHACPGRFFASAELKLIMAHLLMRYDFKLEGEPDGKRPDNTYLDFMTMPPACKMQIRLRVS